MQQSENPLLNENTLLLLDLISSAGESALEVQQTFKNIPHKNFSYKQIFDIGIGPN
jgi:hypothetical protein